MHCLFNIAGVKDVSEIIEEPKEMVVALPFPTSATEANIEEP